MTLTNSSPCFRYFQMKNIKDSLSNRANFEVYHQSKSINAEMYFLKIINKAITVNIPKINNKSLDIFGLFIL